ncbi:hypothetical protein BDZ45DRAFT_755031 [Acephala macrosclerotiorum]|nr:hypothetical protein BDZ45DRAFT_755031 [Acephala macrosclerotiorum]
MPEKAAPIVSPDASVGSDMISSFSDVDTDWGEDEITDTLQDINISDSGADGISTPQNEGHPHLIGSILSPIKQLLSMGSADHGSYSHDYQDQNLAPCGTENGTSSALFLGPNTRSEPQHSGEQSTNKGKGKQKRADQDDRDQDGRKERDPKRLGTLLSPPRGREGSSKFACPYRKHNPRKCCVLGWRSMCADASRDSRTTYTDSIASSHVNDVNNFRHQGEVNDHLNQPVPCEQQDIELDGLTSDVVERSRSKKNAHRNQSEEERWRDIYQILFPNEEIPSPCKSQLYLSFGAVFNISYA